MPKQKTHKGAAKRFKVTARGKVRRAKASRRHLLSGKSAKRRRGLRRPGLVSAAEQAIIREVLRS